MAVHGIPTPTPSSARWVVALLLGLLLLGLAPAAGAQEKGKTAEAGAAAPSEPPAVPDPQAIAADELAEKSQEAQQQLAQMQERAKQIEAVRVVEEKLPEAEKRLEEAAAKARELFDSDPSENQVATLEAEWVGRRQSSVASRKILEERLKPLREDLETLEQMRARWEEARDSASAEKLPKAVRDRVGETLAAIAQTEKAVRNQRSSVLTVQSRMVEGEATITGVLDRITEVRAELRDQLLRFDSPPVWTALAAGRDAEGDLGSRIHVTWSEDLRVIETYFRSRTQSVVLYLVVMAMLGVVLVYLRRPAKAWAEDDPAFEASAQILSRPVSALGVVALLGVPLVFQSSPPILNASVGVLLVAPALRLLIPILRGDLRYGLYGLTLWYVLDWSRFVLVEDRLAERMLLLFMTLTVLVFLAWLLRPARLSMLRDEREVSGWLRAIGRGARVGFFVLLVGAVANLLGNVSLAEMLMNASLISAYLAYIIYAVAQVLDGVYAGLLRTDGARSLRMVRYHRPLLRERGRTFIRVFLAAVWIWAMLGAFEIRQPVYDAVGAIVSARADFGDISISLGDILAFGLAVWATFLISRFVRFVLEEDVLPRASLPRGVPYAVSTAVRYVILVIGFLLAVAAAGFDLGRFALMAGALGVGIGIGLQDVVNNFVSGLILLFERPIQTGDTVEVGGVMGEVRRIGMRSSTVRTWDGAEVLIPNARFVSDQFVNWTLSDRHRRMTIPVGVKYGTDPERVLEILLEQVKSHAEILDAPEPAALFNGFGESSLDFEVRAWTQRSDAWRQVQSEITVSINAALKEAGIEIPFPQRDLHLRSVDPDVSIK